MALAFLRRHQRWFHVLLGLVILGFIVFYIPMFTDTAVGGANEEVGRVGDLPITAREYQTRYSRLRNRYEQMTRKPLDANMLRMLGLDRQVFDDLVEQRIVELEANRLGLKVSDKDVAQSVAALPFLQENGRFLGAEVVKRWADSQGMTIAELERMMRQDLLRKQLESLVTDGVTVTPNEVQDEFKKRNEEIKAEYVHVDSARLQAGLSAGEDEVRAHFEADKEAYRIPEKRVASYVHVDPSTLRAQATVTDADVRSRYETQISRFKEEEQACSQHILVKVKGEAETTGRTDEQGKKAADDILAQLRAGGDFGAIARKSSEDTVSAAKGGDLGCFARGTMVPEFENVAFNLEPGVLSEPVKTQYGYHIIQLKELRKEHVKPLDEVKETLKAELVTERAQAQAERVAGDMAQALAGGRKLEEAASANGAQVQKSQPVGRGEMSLPFTEEVIGRLFELKPGETHTKPLAVDNGFIFVALAETKESRVPELAEVQERVKADVIAKKAQEQALAKATELRTKAASGGLAKAASALGLTRKETPAAVRRGDAIGELPLGAGVEEAAFTLPAGQVSDPIRVQNGYAVLRVTEKKEMDPAAFEKEKAQIAASLRTTKRNQLFEAYLAQARTRFNVESRPEVLRRFAS
jgi:peptidyl-prolyl cis-trans isomerase D